jgi:hypothetical protein
LAVEILVTLSGVAGRQLVPGERGRTTYDGYLISADRLDAVEELPSTPPMEDPVSVADTVVDPIVRGRRVSDRV